MLELDHVNCHYAKVHVLHDVSLEVNEGEIVSMIGPNAAGKTTTLRVTAGLKPPSAGPIRYLGAAIPRLLPWGRGGRTDHDARRAERRDGPRAGRSRVSARVGPCVAPRVGRRAGAGGRGPQALPGRLRTDGHAPRRDGGQGHG